MTGPAMFKVPKQRHKAKDAKAQLIKVDGEVVTVDEACERTGRTRPNLRALYREGKRTWAELTKGAG